MNEQQEKELHEAITFLGKFYSVPDSRDKTYLISTRDECIEYLNVLIFLSKAEGELGDRVHLKLGEWKTMSGHLVPLIHHYGKDFEIMMPCMRLAAEMTAFREFNGADPHYKLQHLQNLQDYKQSFSKKDSFISVMNLLVKSVVMEDLNEEQKKLSAEGVDDILVLLRNLTCVPDPRSGDGGFSLFRRTLQLDYIQQFHEEGLFEFLSFIAEHFWNSQDTDKIWVVLEIVYHMITQLDPEEVCQIRKEKDKKILGELLEREKEHARIRMPQSSRHSRFGTQTEERTAQGERVISSSISALYRVEKGSKMWRKEFHDTERRGVQNVFHDPFFVDLEEGSVKEHNRLNAHIRSSNDTPKAVKPEILRGLRAFLDEFVSKNFSKFVSFIRGVLVNPSGSPNCRPRKFGRQVLLNFISWVLEYFRYQHNFKVTAATKAKQAKPLFAIAEIQGAIDIEMVEFVCARVKEYGKESNIHHSNLVIVLRALSQMVKTIAMAGESTDSETRDCSDLLVQNIVKYDALSHVRWIMQNYKTSSHDPRIMSYAIEVTFYMHRLMNTLVKRQDPTFQFTIERVHGRHVSVNVTTIEQEISTLADARVVENLFHLLEKYNYHSASFNKKLCKLLFSIVTAQETNVVIFFELAYFYRMSRILSDPMVRDRKLGQKYEDMLYLLRYILRQFFKCAEKNHCVFAELLFRKVKEKQRDSLLSSHQQEFAAILNNYEDEEYKEILSRIADGESISEMMASKRAMMDGSAPWTESEDNLLKEKYPLYMDHPMFAELLVADLPDDSNRSARQIKKRLQELGLTTSNGTAAFRRVPAADDGDEPPMKKLKTVGEDGDSDDELERAKAAANAQQWTMPDSNMPPADVANIDEEDLERLLDATLDEHGDTLFLDSNTAAFEQTQAQAATALDTPQPKTQAATAIDASLGTAHAATALDTQLGTSHTATVPELGTAYNATVLDTAASKENSLEKSQSLSQGLDLEMELGAMIDEPQGMNNLNMGLDDTQGMSNFTAELEAMIPEVGSNLDVQPSTHASVLDPADAPGPSAGNTVQPTELDMQDSSQRVATHASQPDLRQPADTQDGSQRFVSDVDIRAVESELDCMLNGGFQLEADTASSQQQDEESRKFWDGVEASNGDKQLQPDVATSSSQTGSRSLHIELDLERIMDEDFTEE